MQKYICKNCNKEFKAYKITGGIDRIFCSRKCFTSNKKKNSIGFCKLKNPNLSINSTLMYIVGVLYGDGYISVFKGKKGGTNYTINLNVNDKEFAESFSDALYNIGLNPKIINLEKYKLATTKFRTTCYSSKFISWYSNLGLENIRDICNNNKDYIIAFFKGLYESDGNFHYIPKKSFYNLNISNSNLYLLEMLSFLLQKIGFSFKIKVANRFPKEILLNGKIAKFKKPVYSLYLYKRNQIKDLLLAVNPSIPRKKWDFYKQYA